jgi:ferredoxin
MCEWCELYATEGKKWYEEPDNYLFQKIFPTVAEQEQKKKEITATFTEMEWRLTEPAYINDVDYLRRQNFSAQIVVKEEVLQILRLAEEAAKLENAPLVLGHCPCRLVYDGTRDYCCIGFGMSASLSMEMGFGRLPREGLTEFGGADWRELRREMTQQARVPLKLAEAEKLIDDWERRGLWHIVVSRGHMPLVAGICNCDSLYCTSWRNRFHNGIPQYVRKGHFVARVNHLKCAVCGWCLEMCQFGALHCSRSTHKMYIDLTACFGCGLCRSTCPHHAIEMVPRAEIPAARDRW